MSTYLVFLLLHHQWEKCLILMEKFGFAAYLSVLANWIDYKVRTIEAPAAGNLRS